MSWDVEYTDQFGNWYHGLSDREQQRIDAAVRELAATGPALGRPHVDTIKRSRHANMKELRPLGGHLRILFAFDPRRSAILLAGGDKTGRWRAFYNELIPIADDLYDEHLAMLKKEGLQP